MSVVDENAAANLGVQADFDHMNLADGNFLETLRLMEGKLMHVHLAESNRYILGTGHLDFAAIVQTLKELKFTAYLSLDSVPAKPDWKTVVEQGISYMKQMERQTA